MSFQDGVTVITAEWLNGVDSDIDSLEGGSGPYVRNDISDTMNGSLTVVGDVDANNYGMGAASVTYGESAQAGFTIGKSGTVGLDSEIAVRTGGVETARFTKESRLYIQSSNEATLSTDASFTVGDTSSTNIGVGSKSVSAKDNGAGSTLRLNYYGGDVSWSGSSKSSILKDDGSIYLDNGTTDTPEIRWVDSSGSEYAYVDLSSGVIRMNSGAGGMFTIDVGTGAYKISTLYYTLAHIGDTNSSEQIVSTQYLKEMVEVDSESSTGLVPGDTYLFPVGIISAIALDSGLYLEMYYGSGWVTAPTEFSSGTIVSDGVIFRFKNYSAGNAFWREFQQGLQS